MEKGSEMKSGRGREARIERDVEAGHTFESLHNFLHSRKLWHMAN